MKNIVLTGYMGSGKSTVGKLLAKKLGCRFIDVDEAIESKEKMSITDIFKKEGEEGFRNIESDVIEELSHLKNTVIATGGGAVLRKKNIDVLRKNGVIILLKTDLDTIVSRVLANDKRPLAKNKTKEEIQASIKAREPYYNNNDFACEISGKSPLQVCADIIDIYKKF